MFSMLHSALLDKNKLDDIFSFLADEYKKTGSKETINIYVVGGAAIVINFTYRLSTIDVDALYELDPNFEKAKEAVKNKYKLNSDWLNNDFISTPSYSPKIVEYSNLFKSYSNLINIYVLEPKYLIAMKLKSSRPTGGDLDDIIKMIYELRLNNKKITFDEIISAYKDLYSSFDNTYDYFINKTIEAFETPLEDILL